MVAKRPGATDSIRAWIVYPERSTKAPVVVVIQEIFGNTSWLRGVADQLAHDGYIAIAPDLFTGRLSPAAADTLSMQPAFALTQTLVPEEVQQQIESAARYAMALPAALPKYGVVGFCWGGGASFQHAVRSPAGLAAAVVYYGQSPSTEQLTSVRVPVLGLYGGNDARVDMTIPPADSAMRAMGKTYEHTVFEGAGHGFLRAQDGQNGANIAATRQAWPMTIAFFRRYLAS
jgi:carboxymethylenebutenolidase